MCFDRSLERNPETDKNNKNSDRESNMRSAIQQRSDEPGATMLKRQLVREISCLERQLERVRTHDEFADFATLQTYEEMIESRRRMLRNMPWGE